MLLLICMLLQVRFKKVIPCPMVLLFSAIDCGRPQPLQNGSITGRSSVYPNVMHLSCDEGFILRGSSEIQCQTNGTWTKTSSFCKGWHNVLYTPKLRSIKITKLMRFTAFSQSRWIKLLSVLFPLPCDMLPHLQKPANSFPISMLIYHRLLPLAKDCGQLPVPLNGSHFGRETTFPNEAMFSCDEGFNLNGSSVRRCLSNGSWSGTETFCEGKISFMI